jgi:FkbM family methyltransferase
MFDIFNKKLKGEKVVFYEHSYYPGLISKKPVLIDLGACHGSFSQHFLEAFPKAEIIIVEANPTNFNKIKINNKRCRLLNKAVSLTEEKIIFYEDENSPHNGSFIFNYFDGKKHEIETVSFEALLSQYRSIDLVKMDIEGAEWEILLNTPDKELLKINQLSVEFHDFLSIDKRSLTIQCVERMKKLGYKLEFQSTDYMQGSDYYDCLFYKE